MVHRNKKRTKQAPLGKYLSPAGLEELKQYKSATGTHKYVSAPLVSKVDQLMTYYWEFVVNLMPLWLAPNLITTISFLHAVLAHLLITWYSPNLIEPAPRWAYILVSVCMFLYQTLDAIDGKQARRTKNGSPLGQLFDHGCDAITAWIMGIFVAATVQCGPTLTSFIMMNMIVVPFFAANWEESITHVMRFGMVGVTEGQFIVMGVELFTGLLGADVWFTRIFPDILGIDMVTSFDLFTLVIGVSAIGATYQCVSSVYTVFKFYRQHPEESREQGIVSFIQFFVVLGFGFAWVLAPSGFYPSHPRIILTVTGMLASYQASRLIVCHTTGEPFPWCFVVCFPFPFVVLNEWSGRWFGKHDQDVYFPSFYVGWAYGVFIAVLYAHFIVVTIDQITTFLGIKCFKIKPKVVEPPAIVDRHALDAVEPHIDTKVYGKASKAA